MGLTRYFRNTFFILSCLFLCLFLTGCPNGLMQGHYEGNLLRKSGERWEQEPVKIEMIRSDKNSFLFDVKTPNGVERLKATFHLLKSKQFEVQSEFLGSVPILAEPVNRELVQGLEGDQKTQCYKYQGVKILEFCFRSDRFLLRAFDQGYLNAIELSGDYFAQETEFTLEEPVQLTLTQAVRQSFQQNFDSRIGYQKVVQARLAATTAYMNLVPHLTTNLIWNAAPNYITYIATLQGLVPFLLPSYWFQAKQASIEREIQEMSLLIMRANLVSTVEELAYALKRDEGIVADQQRFLREVLEFQAFLNQRTLPVEAEQLLRELSEFMKVALTSDIGDMTKLVRQDRFSLAESLGFHNIEAIKSIEIDQEHLPIEQALLVDPKELADLAIQRSFELKQLEDLKRIAKLKKLQNYFIWLDPSGDPNQSLGLNTFPQQKKAKSQIQELEIEREKSKTTLHQNAYKLSLDFNEAIQSHQSLRDGLGPIRFDFQEIVSEAISGKPIHSDNLKWRAQRYSAGLVAGHVTLANFRIARAKRDRFLLAGYYSELLPRLFQEFSFPKNLLP